MRKKAGILVLLALSMFSMRCDSPIIASGNSPDEASKYLSYPMAGLDDITFLTGMTEVIFLNLDFNTFSSLTPLSNMKNLQHLSIIGCSNVKDISPIAGLTSLSYLDLSYDSIAPLTALSGLTNLEYLSLYSCQGIADISPLASLSKLKSLNLGYMKGINNIAALAPLANMEILNLRGTAIKELSHIAGMSKLKRLDLSNCDSIRTFSFSTLPSLEALILQENISLTSFGLAGSPLLKYIEIGNRGWSPVGQLISLYLSGLSGLQRLTINQPQTLGAVAFSGLSSLSYLDLSSKPLPDYSFLSSLTSLDSLTLTYSNSLDFSLLSLLPKLKKVSLYRTKSPKDVVILSGFPALKNIKLAICDSIESIAIGNLPVFEELQIQYAHQLSSIAIANMLTLRRIYLQDCPLNLFAAGNIGNLNNLTLRECGTIGKMVLPGNIFIDSLILNSGTKIDSMPQFSSLAGIGYLDFSDNTQLDSLSCLKGVTYLKRLNLSSCFNLKDISGLSTVTNMEYINISYLSSFSNINYAPLVACLGSGDTCVAYNTSPPDSIKTLLSAKGVVLIQ